ncbi:Mitochondrial sodium/hydrogen exchanger 9B2, partial [Ophiophagus hannah]
MQFEMEIGPGVLRSPFTFALINGVNGKDKPFFLQSVVTLSTLLLTEGHFTEDGPRQLAGKGRPNATGPTHNTAHSDTPQPRRTTDGLQTENYAQLSPSELQPQDTSGFNGEMPAVCGYQMLKVMLCCYEGPVTALNKLKAVCFRLCMGPCITEACSAAVISHFIMKFPWVWGFMLGFVLGAVSPAVVVLSMLMLQRQGLGVDQGIPTLLIAAASIDDIVAITGFNIFLGMAFSSGSTLRSIFRGLVEVKSIVWKRAFFVIGLSAFSLLCSKRFGFPGSGGLCVIVLSFLAGMSWSNEKKAVQEVVTFAWQVSQPFLFGLIGAEISITSLGLETVGLCLSTMFLALMARIVATFLLVSFSGFHWKEKIFIALAWIPKATVQAAIGSVALDTARGYKDKVLEKYGLYILTIAFLAILITAPAGAVIIGLAGPRLLHKSTKGNEDDLAIDSLSPEEKT